MTKITAAVGILLSLLNGCALDSASSEEGDNVGSVKQKIGNNSRHFVNASLVSGFADCPWNEMLVGVDPTSSSRLVCDTMSGTVFDGSSVYSEARGHYSAGTATCHSAYAVAVGWNHATGALHCRLVTPGPILDYTPDGAGTTNVSQLSANCHQTTTFSWWNGTFTDEMTVCTSYRAIRDISLKTLTGGGSTFFYTCAT